jgi:uncharacterized phiE125 gp8 family phage protein
MALITLAELKTFMSVTDASQDTLLQIFVDSTDAFVKNYTHRALESAEYTAEIYDGPGTPMLTLKEYPVTEIDEIIQWDEEVELSTDITDSDGYYLKDDYGIVYHRTCWDRGRGIITATYTAGYATIPSDLKHACLACATFFVNMSNKQGITHENLGSYSYSLASGLVGDLTIPDIVVKNILDRYKRSMIGIMF